MSYFTKNLLCEDRGSCEFRFNRISTVHGIRYHVSVLTRNGPSHHFSMEPDGSVWKIVTAPKPPEWVMKLEFELSNAILHHLKTV